VFFGHPPLALVRRAVSVDVGHRSQLVGAVQRRRDRLQPGQQIGQFLGDQAFVVVGV
jgi:hypothetical protein